MATIPSAQAAIPTFFLLDAPELEVPATQLEILGAGVQNKSTGEINLLACSGKLKETGVLGCEQMRMVSVFPQSDSAKFFGLIFVLDQSQIDSKAGAHQIIKAISK